MPSDIPHQQPLQGEELHPGFYQVVSENQRTKEKTIGSSKSN